ncbi:MAG TPA: IS1595 family transposase [Terracidiphilus sp.]
MQQVNRYFRFAKISEAKFRHLLRCFALDLSATQTARMTGISVRSVNPIFQRLREKLAQECEKISPFSGDLEADESYFGPHRVRGRRGRGAGRKTIVFGLLKRDDKVYTQIMTNLSRAALQAVIRGHAELDSTIHTDGWSGYDGLVDLGYARHFRVYHGDDEFAVGPNHINGIESFWGFAKHRLTKFHGVSKSTFPLHLKETEFRFNHRKDDLYKVLLSLLRKDPL